MKAVISEKGQVTIPKKLRDKLGLTAGTAIEFQDRKGTLIGKKIVSGDDPFVAVTGIVGPVDADKYLEEVRGPAE